MTLSAERQTELIDLIDKVCDATVTSEQAARLEEALIHDREAQWLYLRRVHLHGNLLWHCESHSEWATLRQLREQAATASPVAAGTDHPFPLPAPATSSSILDLFGNAVYGTVGYVSSGWPLAYLVATVIFGLGLLVGSRIYVSQPTQVAKQSVPLPSSLSPLPSTVGRVTGMVDCKWESRGLGIRDWGLEHGAGGGERGAGRTHFQSLIPNPQSLVRLGDKFALRSGLMEITYDTGAKVILQGPVTYEVESTNGGFLSIGKLTGKLERKVASAQWLVASTSEIRNQKSETSYPQSLIPNASSLSTIHDPLFTIKTPTAIVTDLGTEFGVEVHKSGTSEVHVLTGAVDLVARQGGRHWQLRADTLGGSNARAARVEADSGENGGAKIVLVTPEPHRFLRVFPKSPAAKRGERVLIGSWFNLSSEGWMVNSPAGTELLYVRDGGNPGGCIQTQEGIGPDFFYFIAPPEYGGDRSATLGGQLKFDVFTTIFHSLPNQPETMAMEPPLVILQGRDYRIAADQTQRVERDKWNSLTVPLSAAGKWYRLAEKVALEGKQTDRTPISEDVIRAVLADLREVWIRAEYMHGLDRGRLDNVLMVAPADASEKTKPETSEPVNSGNVPASHKE